MASCDFCRVFSVILKVFVLLVIFGQIFASCGDNATRSTMYDFLDEDGGTDEKTLSTQHRNVVASRRQMLKYFVKKNQHSGAEPSEGHSNRDVDLIGTQSKSNKNQKNRSIRRRSRSRRWAASVSRDSEDQVPSSAATCRMANWDVNAPFVQPSSARTATFTTAAAYVVTNFRPYTTFCITFAFRTAANNGLILFSGDVSSGISSVGYGSDFMSVELHEGRLRYAFDLGSGTRVLQSHLANLNDNMWHTVGISRPSMEEHRLEVDGHVTTTDDLPPAVTSSRQSFHLDTGDQLYVGGVPAHAYSALPTQVRSRDGFIGCLSELRLDVGGATTGIASPVVDLVGNPFGIPDLYRRHIRTGCPDWESNGPGTGSRCADEDHGVCKNGGFCTLRNVKGVTCNCDMTSFTGKHCTEDSISYSFNNRSGGGLVTYSFPTHSWPDTRRDQLALGFRTFQADAVLLRVTSGSSTDYIELELVEGSVLVVYNMGLANHPVGAFYEKVNDGRYHRVRYYRDGPNATIQVDDLPIQAKFPTGQQLTTFNHQAKVFVGGRKDETTGQIQRAYHGTMSGVVFNGIRILDLASERDDQISIEGDVQLQVHTHQQPVDDLSGVSPTLAPWQPRATVNTDVFSKLYPSSKSTHWTQTSGVKPQTPVGDLPGGTSSGTDFGSQNTQQPCDNFFPNSAKCLRSETNSQRQPPEIIGKPLATSRTTSATPFQRHPATTTHAMTSDADDYEDSKPSCDDDEDCDGSGSDSSSEQVIVEEPETEIEPIRTPTILDADWSAAGVPLETPTPHAFVKNVSLSVDKTEPEVTPPWPEEDAEDGTEVDDGDLENDRDDDDIVRSELPPDHPAHRQPPSAVTGTGIGLPASQYLSFGTNVGLMAGIAAGIVVLLAVLAYAVCRYRGCNWPGSRRGVCRKDFTPCSSSAADSSIVAPKGVSCAIDGDHPSLAPTLGATMACRGPAVGHHAAAYMPLLRGDSSASNAALIASSTAPSGFLPATGASLGTDDAAGNRNTFGSVGRRKTNKDVKEWFV